MVNQNNWTVRLRRVDDTLPTLNKSINKLFFLSYMLYIDKKDVEKYVDTVLCSYCMISN